MLTKPEWIANEKAKQKKAREAGYTDEEIAFAYKIAKIMGVSYLSDYGLARAKEELKTN